MKIDEAKRILSACKGCNYLVPGDGFAGECTADGKCFNAKIMAIEALNKQAIREKTIDKYRWHDLRENPNELPCGGEYLCLAQSRNPYCEDKKEIIEYVYDVIEFHRGKFMKGESKYFISNIIAWREIEPFEEEE